MAEDLRAEAREQIARTFEGLRLLNQHSIESIADAVLALPAVQEALAAAEAVKRVEALADEWIDRSPTGLGALAGAGRAVRHALAGEDR